MEQYTITAVYRQPGEDQIYRSPVEAMHQLRKRLLPSILWWRVVEHGAWERLGTWKGRAKYVGGDDGDYYVMVPDEESRWGFYLTDGDQSWDGGIGAGLATWSVVKAKNVPDAIRKELGPLHTYYNQTYTEGE